MTVEMLNGTGESKGALGCEDSRESGRKKSAMINVFDKLSHFEKETGMMDGSVCHL